MSTMKNKILGLGAGLAMIAAVGATTPAEAQISVPIPGTNIRVNVGDPYYNRYNDPYYYRYNRRPYYNNYNNYYNYNRYPVQRGFWMDGAGRARWNNGFYTGWRGNVYYRNGYPTRSRNTIYWY